MASAAVIGYLFGTQVAATIFGRVATKRHDWAKPPGWAWRTVTILAIFWPLTLPLAVVAEGCMALFGVRRGGDQHE